MPDITLRNLTKNNVAALTEMLFAGHISVTVAALGKTTANFYDNPPGDGEFANPAAAWLAYTHTYMATLSGRDWRRMSLHAVCRKLEAVAMESDDRSEWVTDDSTTPPIVETKQQRNEAALKRAIQRVYEESRKTCAARNKRLGIVL